MKKYSKYDRSTPDPVKKGIKNPMGQGSFANLPDKQMIMPLPRSANYESGVLNNPAAATDGMD